MVGVWYLVSLETAMPEQIEQSGFNAVTRTVNSGYQQPKQQG